MMLGLRSSFPILTAAVLLAVSPARSETTGAEGTAKTTPVDLAAERTQASLLSRSEDLYEGHAAAADNPLRVRDMTTARALLVEALGMPGPARGRVATKLARMLLAGEGGPRDAAEAVRLLQIGVEFGEGSAALDLARALERGAAGPADAKAAERYYRIAMGVGNASAFFELARLVGPQTPEGRSVVEAGVKLVERNISAGERSALVQLGDLYVSGELVERDLNRGRDLLIAADAGGEASAALRIARLYLDDQGPMFNLPEARKWVLRAASLGDISAAREVWSDGLFGGPLGIDAAVGRQWLDRGLAAGDPGARLYGAALADVENSGAPIGDRLRELLDIRGEVGRALDGQVLTAAGRAIGARPGRKASEIAALLYAGAAERGDAEGGYLFARGVLARLHQAAPSEVARAVELLRELTGKGHVDATILLASAYNTGRGVERSPKRAYELLSEAIERHHDGEATRLVMALADMLVTGADGKQAAEAVHLYERAAIEGSAQSMTALGRIYSDGIVVARDDLLAIYWLEQATKLGDRDAFPILGDLLVTSGDMDDRRKAAAIHREMINRGDERGYERLMRDATWLGGDAELIKVVRTAAEKGSVRAALALFAHEVRSLRRTDPLPPAALAALARAEANAGSLPAARLLVAREISSYDRPELDGRVLPVLEAMNAEGDLAAKTTLAELYLSGRAGSDKAALGRGMLEDAYKAGWAPAAVRLAHALALKQGGDADPARALALLQTALDADPGNPTIGFELAGAYERGTGVERDMDRAMALYRMAANQGSTPAMAALGRILATGSGVPADPDAALRWLRRAAASGEEVTAIVAYARQLAALGSPGEAVLSYLRAARLGSTDAMLQLSRFYLAGIGTTINRDEGYAWLLRAAEAGNNAAMFDLFRYLTLVPRDRDSSAEARKWLRRSAEAGNLDATYRLGLAIYLEAKTDGEREEGLRWLTLAKDSKHMPAAHALLAVTAARASEAGSPDTSDEGR